MAAISVDRKVVVIVGAGMSGVVAAHSILKSDINREMRVVMLEGRSRPGGRTFAARMPGTDIEVDLGASWIHGPKNNPASRLAELYSVKHFPVPMPFEPKSFSVAHNGSSPNCPAFSNRELQKYASYFEELIGELEDEYEGTTTSLRDALAVKMSEYEGASDKVLSSEGVTPEDVQIMKVLLPIFLECLSIMIGGDPAHLPACGGYEEGGGGGLDGGDNMVLSFGKLFEKLLDDLQAEQERFQLALDCPVHCIEKFEERILIRCGNGTTQLADKVIVTIPLGVLKQTHTSLFRPNLPDWKVDAINKIGVGIVGKLYLMFDSAFWQTTGVEEKCSQAQWHFFPDLSISNKEKITYRVFLDATSILGRPILVGFSGGRNATSIEKMTEEEAVQTALNTLESGWGLDYSLRAHLVSSIKSSWGNDEFSCGAYSYLHTNAVQEDRVKLQRPIAVGGASHNVFFAGEHTSGKWAATVHGAISTGIEAAEAILASYNMILDIDAQLKLPKRTLRSSCITS